MGGCPRPLGAGAGECLLPFVLLCTWVWASGPRHPLSLQPSSSRPKLPCADPDSVVGPLLGESAGTSSPSPLPGFPRCRALQVASSSPSASAQISPPQGPLLPFSSEHLALWKST